MSTLFQAVSFLPGLQTRLEGRSLNNPRTVFASVALHDVMFFASVVLRDVKHVYVFASVGAAVCDDNTGLGVRSLHHAQARRRSVRVPHLSCVSTLY